MIKLIMAALMLQAAAPAASAAALECEVIIQSAYAGPKLQTEAVSNLNKDQIGIFMQYESEAKLEFYQEKLAAGVEDVRAYLNHFAKGHRTFEVRGYLMPLTGDMQKDNPNSPNYAGTAISEYMAAHPELFAEVGFVPYYRHVWTMVWSGDGLCGSAYLNAGKGVTYKLCNSSVILHELGHNLGLHHAATEFADEYEEYGDRVTSIMGGGQRQEPLNAIQLHQLQWEGPGQRAQLSVLGSTELYLAPLEIDLLSLRDHEYTSVEFIVGRETYTLSRMATQGFPYAIPDKYAEAVFVMKNGERGRSVRLLPDLYPGEKISFSDGTLVEYLEYAAGYSKLAVTQAGDIATPVAKLASPFPPSYGDVVPEDTGYWWDADYDGQGFDVQVRSDRVVVYFYTFSDDGLGTRRFFYAVGTRDSALSGDMTLFTTEDGTFADPTEAQELVLGKAQLYFYSERDGVFQWESTEHGRGSVQLTRLSPPTLTHRIYGVAGREGEGFTLQVFDTDHIVGLWYTYGRAYSWQSKAAQRWFIIWGDPDHMTVSEVTGGQFQHSSPVTLTTVGTARFDLERDVFFYDGALGAREYQLFRLLESDNE